MTNRRMDSSSTSSNDFCSVVNEWSANKVQKKIIIQIKKSSANLGSVGGDALSAYSR